MKIVTTYVAFDDKEFDYEEECLAYEQYHMNLMIELNMCYVMYDKNMHPLSGLYAHNIEDALKEFEYTYEECNYILMKKVPSKELIHFIRYYFGYELPNEKAGIYYYNFNEGRWHKI